MTGNDEPVAGEVGTGPSPPRRDGAHRHGVFAMVAAVARTVQVERRLGEGWILGRAAHAHRADRLAAVREAHAGAGGLQRLSPPTHTLAKLPAR